MAVYVLSPVTILTIIPAFLQFSTDYGTDYLRGFFIPARHITIKFVYNLYGSEVLTISF